MNIFANMVFPILLSVIGIDIFKVRLCKVSKNLQDIITYTAHHIISTPKTNGVVECFNSTFITQLTQFQEAEYKKTSHIYNQAMEMNDL